MAQLECSMNLISLAEEHNTSTERDLVFKTCMFSLPFHSKEKLDLTVVQIPLACTSYVTSGFSVTFPQIMI